MNYINGLHFNNLRGDIYGGLTAAVVALPLAMAMGIASGVGMVMASFLFMKRITDMQIASMKTITKPGEEVPLSQQETEIMEQENGQIMLFHLNGPMSFSSAKSLVRRHSLVVDYQIMVLDLTEAPHIDFTTTRALKDIITNTTDAGQDIFLVGTRNAVRKMLEKQDVLQYIDKNNIYIKRIDALLQAQQLLNETAATSDVL